MGPRRQTAGLVLRLPAYPWRLAVLLSRVMMVGMVGCSEFAEDRWIMNVWSVTNYSVKGDQFGFQLLSHMETQWMAKNIFDRGWIEPHFVAQPRDNALYEQMIRAGTMQHDFYKVLETFHVPCDELFDCSAFAQYHDRYLTLSDLEDLSGELLEIDHLIVQNPGNIGGQACAEPSKCSMTVCPPLAADTGGPRVMEFFNRPFLVKRITCIARMDSDYTSKLLNAIDDSERLVALAVGRSSINAFTQCDPSQFGKELWTDDPTILGRPTDFPSILAQLQPSLRISAMGEALEQAMGRPFLAAHWRRGDRGHPEMASYGAQMWELSEPANVACLINKMIDESQISTVFVATNSGTPADRETLRALVHGRTVFFQDLFNASATHELHAMVTEMFLCRRSEMFLSAGNSHWRSSTISRIIARMFDMDGWGAVYYLDYCKAPTPTQAARGGQEL